MFDANCTVHDLQTIKSSLKQKLITFSFNCFMLQNSEALQYKEEGNKFYKDGNYDEAIVAYTKALTLSQDLPKSDQAVFYKNRAACHLKLDNNEQAAQDAKAGLYFSYFLQHLLYM